MFRNLQYSNDIIEQFSGNIEQVFLYITNKCNLRCQQCFYKKELNNQEMELDTALFHAEQCAFMGAKKITLLGGEPSLYDLKNNWKNLKILVNELPRLGYENIRLDTNGQFEELFLNNIRNLPITELSFSLDGGNKDQNDKLRGDGVFSKVIENIEHSVCNNFKTSVTVCVSHYNKKTIIADVKKLSVIGVQVVNFHPLLKVGNEQDTYVFKSFITPEEWIHICQKLRELSFEVQLKLRIPPRFFGGAPLRSEQGYCSLKNNDRLHIQPNGEMRICPLTIGTQLRTAHLVGTRFMHSRENNEQDNIDNNVVCSFQKAHKKSYTPLCVSYKPSQNE